MCGPALLAAMAVGIALALCRPAMTAAHTIAFALEVLPSPVKIQSQLAPQPTRQRISYTGHDGVVTQADIYRIEDGKPHNRVLVVLGANAAGAEDPDVVNLGQALSRAGFTVMYYWSQRLGEEGNLDPLEIDDMVAAFQHLNGMGSNSGGRTGIAGFSAGASLALAAAADARIAREVAFVSAFGGYYDAEDLIVQIAAGRRLNGEEEEAWAVDELTRRVFINEVTESIADAGRRERFREAARAGEPLPAAGDTRAERAAAKLLAGGLTIAEARYWYSQLPESYRRQVAQVSPATYVEEFHPDTRILIMHDRGDRLIPVGESRRLAAALKANGAVKVRYSETDVFEHVRPGANARLRPLLRGGAQLFKQVYGVIGEARRTEGGGVVSCGF